MPLKPLSPSSKDLDYAIQDVHEQIEDLINHTHHQMDERFHKASQNLKHLLGNIDTRMNNQQKVLDSTHESIMNPQTNLMPQNGLQQTTIVHTITYSSSKPTNTQLP